jgi:GNAT superfamily N-acetyltransferase
MSADVAPAVSAAPITPEDAGPLAALFEREGCPCYCRYWHFAGTNKEWEARCAFERSKSRDELVSAVRAQSVEGQGMVARVASRPGEIVGWLKLVPRSALTKLLVRSPYKGLAEESRPEGSGDVLAVGCLLIDPLERRRGIAHALVEAAIAEARRRGAQALEAYPRDAREPVHDGELWMGPRSVYDRLGFALVRGEGGQYPVLRRGLAGDGDAVATTGDRR